MTLLRKAGDGIYRPTAEPLVARPFQGNAYAGDLCHRCKERKQVLHPQSVAGRWGEETRMVCVACMGTLNGQKRKSRTADDLALRYNGGPVPAGNYTVSRVCVIVSRQRSTVIQEVRRQKLGRLLPGASNRKATGPARRAGIYCDHRVLNAKEVEQLRGVFEERDRRLNRQRRY